MDESPWHAAALSWGQFLLAMLVALGGVGAMFVSAHIENERRMLLVEERQQYVLRTLNATATETVAFRQELGRKLDLISAQLAQMQIDLVRHQGGKGNGHSSK